MDREGVPRHKHSTVAADVLGISYSQAHRKVQKDSPWSLEELQRFAGHYGQTLRDLIDLVEEDTSQAAVLLTGSIRVPCRVWVGDPVSIPRAGSLVAIRVSSEWVVMAAGDDVPTPAYALRRLVVHGVDAPVKRLAVLDDSRDQADSLCDYLLSVGFEAAPFYSATHSPAR